MSGLHLGAPDPTRHWSRDPDVAAFGSTAFSDWQRRRAVFWKAVIGLLVCAFLQWTAPALWGATGDPEKARDAVGQFVSAARDDDAEKLWDLLCLPAKVRAFVSGPSTEEADGPGTLEKLRDGSVRIGPAVIEGGGYTVELVIDSDGHAEVHEVPVRRSVVNGYQVCS